LAGGKDDGDAMLCCTSGDIIEENCNGKEDQGGETACGQTACNEENQPGEKICEC